jgi:SAM-dependent methyltransferase
MENGFKSNQFMEDVETCPLCKSPKKKFLFQTYDRLYRFPEKFGTFLCEQCGLIRISPRPTVEAISRYYPAEYGAYVEIKNPEDEISSPDRPLSGLRNGIRDSVLSSLGYYDKPLKSWQKIFRPLFNKMFQKRTTYGYGELFPTYVPNGRALEVGIGNGQYLNYLKRHGWNVAGIDLSPQAAQVAKKLFDIDVFVGQLEECPFSDEEFDYIHLSHVVEHFFDPLESIKKVFSLLKKGGIVYIEVPNGEGFGAKISKEYWYGWDAPRHLFTFTPKTLKLLVEESGFKVNKISTKVWNSYNWAETYKQEEKLNKKLEQRPPAFPDSKVKIFVQNTFASLFYNVTPQNGDFIRCWITKT